MDHRITPEAAAMRRRFVLFLVVLGIVAIGVVSCFALRGSMDIFSSAGPIAAKERDLIVFASILSLIVIIPVFGLTFFIAWKYRETNTHAKYEPDWDHNIVAETIWWLIPILIISVLAVVTWQSTHALDPSKSIASSTKPLNVQVVALQWRWLFLYPDQGVASMDYLALPTNTPVHFQITSDAPMNSFWIPKLGGQIYAMAGMSTTLNLMASETGDYRGSSANISGSGFADMDFIAHASSAGDFSSWIAQTKQSRPLDFKAYQQLAKPTNASGRYTYALADKSLYDTIMMQYMHSQGGTE
jgi:cytochrome o ubiquinol oxidase subunit 2